MIEVGSLIPDSLENTRNIISDVGPYIFLFLGVAVGMFIIDILMDIADAKSEKDEMKKFYEIYKSGKNLRK